MEEELLERIGGAQRQTKIVEFPVDYFTPLISNFTQMDDDFGRIDLYLVEEFLFKLEEFANLPAKRIKVYDHNTVCILEAVEEKGKKFWKHTRVDGLKKRWREIIEYLVRKREASVDDFLDDVFGNPLGKRNRYCVYNAINQLDNFLLENNYGFSIAQNENGKYQILFNV